MLQVLGKKLGLRGEVLGREALAMLRPAWEDLCRRSAEDNVYYAPRYALALLDSVEEGRDIRVAAVWDGDRLVALFPFTRVRLAIPGLRPSARAWQSRYTFSCMPLLDRSCTEEAAVALLEVLASVSDGEWVVPTVNAKGEACQALLAALMRGGLPWVFSGAFQRATLEAGGTFDEHMKQRVSSKRRRELARSRRRLEELGKVAHEVHCSGAGLDRAVSAFLRIEASGWKGKQGTALGCSERTRAFALQAFTGSEVDSICRADILTLDGETIAVSLTVFAGRTGFTVKCCYDETYRNYSAGLLLEAEVIRSFLSGSRADRLDSATAGAHVIDDLWPGRIDVADLIFSLSPRHAQQRLSALTASDRLRRTSRTMLKERAAGLKRYGGNLARAIGKLGFHGGARPDVLQEKG